MRLYQHIDQQISDETKADSIWDVDQWQPDPRDAAADKAARERIKALGCETMLEQRKQYNGMSLESITKTAEKDETKGRMK